MDTYDRFPHASKTIVPNKARTYYLLSEYAITYQKITILISLFYHCLYIYAAYNLIYLSQHKFDTS